MKFARVGGNLVHYRLDGVGPGRPLIVLVNALATELRIWDDLVEALGDGVATLRYDKRGHGLSELGKTPYSAQALASDLAALLDHLRLRPALICGLSVGGFIGQALYAARPDLVPALAICASGLKGGTPEIWNPRIAQAESEGMDTIADQTIARWFPEAFRVLNADTVAAIRIMVARQSAQGYAATAAAVRDADFRDSARFISAPTLCVAGGSDSGVTPEAVGALAAQIPSARLEVFEGVGHLIPVEQPEGLAALLKAHIAH